MSEYQRDVREMRADKVAPPSKYTLCFTHVCNLACPYCYIAKSDTLMSLSVAKSVVDFIFRHSATAGGIEIGFFGGEPLLAFDRMLQITEIIRQHPAYRPERVKLTLTSNGTVFSDRIARFLLEQNVRLCVSCDGPPQIQDRFRRFADGGATSPIVERNLRNALDALPVVLVNAVYHPDTFRSLPATVDYLAELGLRHIYLNPDYSAAWTRNDAEALRSVYDQIADRYIGWYLTENPRFISLLDSKIAVLVRGGFDRLERCRMGTGELAFSPDGGIYPCERLIGDGRNGKHRIGHVDAGVDLSRLSCHLTPLARARPTAGRPQAQPEVALPEPSSTECAVCSVKDLCMNWCGCSNAFMTGYYDRVGPFLCASERAAIECALRAFDVLSKRLGPVFLHHLSGMPHTNSRNAQTQ